MKKDKHITDVIFRVDKSKDFKGTVYALFPHEVCDHKGHVTSYQHVGQHSGADYTHCIRTSRLATQAESNDLKIELRGLGYNLNVVSKQNYAKYLKSYHNRK